MFLVQTIALLPLLVALGILVTKLTIIFEMYIYRQKNVRKAGMDGGCC